MGVQNLLVFVEKACRRANVAEFQGQTVAVDVSCWLHKAIFGCCLELTQNPNCTSYISYCMKFIKTLLSLRIHVILVFDGQTLPAKKAVNQERKERRKQNKAKALQYIKDGKFCEARQLLERATEVTFDVVRELIQACRKLRNVDCMVAPFEADAQIAYLCKCGIAQVAITEDSDLIPFGCEKIIFKMDSAGNGKLYERGKLHLCVNQQVDRFDFVGFRRSCILAGCDYLLQGLHGIGLNKATTFFSKITNNRNLKLILAKIPWYLNNQKFKVSEEFKESFVRAENTFLYQIVYDPIKKKQLPLNPYPEVVGEGGEEEEEGDAGEIGEEVRRGLCASDFPYAGELARRSVAFGMAVGNINPFTKEIVDTYNPSKELAVWSVWNGNYKPGIHRSPAKLSPSKKLVNHATALQIQRISPKKALPNSFRKTTDRPRVRSLGSPKRITETKNECMDEEIAKIYGINTAKTDGLEKEEKKLSRRSLISQLWVESKREEHGESKYFSGSFASTGCSPAARNPFKKPRILTAAGDSDSPEESQSLFSPGKGREISENSVTSSDDEERKSEAEEVSDVLENSDSPSAMKLPCLDSDGEEKTDFSDSEKKRKIREIDWNSFKMEVKQSAEGGEGDVDGLTESRDLPEIEIVDRSGIGLKSFSCPEMGGKESSAFGGISTVLPAKRNVGGGKRSDSLKQKKLGEMFRKFEFQPRKTPSIL